jgi:putative N6-adenine-specific DNA methylase
MNSDRKKSAWEADGEIVLSCAHHLAGFAKSEAQALGFKVTGTSNDSVTLAGSPLDAMRLNLHLRTAHRVLVPLGRFEAKHLEHLYRHASTIPWEDWIDPDGYFTTHGSIKNDTIRDSRVAAMRLKDAIVDRIREVHGRRPDSGREDKGASIYLYWHERDLRIFLDMSGAALSRRGYRLLPGKAPMAEALAAAVVMATGWDPSTPFISPMCGSGTPAIEAAMIARRRAPGLTRSHFAFMSLAGYHGDGDSPEAVWKAECAKSVAAECPSDDMPPIIATDISREAVRISRANAKAARVEQFITFGVCDFADTQLPSPPGTIFMNPEYGERMGVTDNLVLLYERIGHWYAEHPDFSRSLFTSSPRLAKATKLEFASLTPFFNGDLDCRLVTF